MTCHLYTRKHGICTAKNTAAPPIDPVVLVKYLLVGFLAEGLVTGKIVATDSTHMKANASVSSECLVEVQEEPEVYWERLNQYEEQGLEKLKHLKGKRRAERKEPVKKRTPRSHKRVSRTDPEAGHMKRPGKPEGPYYLVHETLDTDHGIILAVTTTAGNVL